MKRKIKVLAIFCVYNLLLISLCTTTFASKIYSIDDTLLSIQNKYDDDSYGGCYIEDDILHINLTKPTLQDTLFCINKKAVIESVNYSSKELKIIQQKIATLLKEVQCATIEINDFNNNIIVSLQKKDEHYIKAIKRMYHDTDLIQFNTLENQIVFSDQSSITPMASSSLYVYAGARINDVSVGFCTSSSGFYTCGHGLSIGSRIYLNNSTLIGTVTRRQLSGKTDAAYVEITNSNYVSIQKWITGETYTAGLMYNRSYVPGRPVTMVGSTSGKETGTIVSSSVTVTSTPPEGGNSVTLTDMVKANYSCKPGDSGGGVFDLNKTALGIHSMGYFPNGTSYPSTYSYFCKFENVTSI